jgi:multidrug efflux pump subunit AcrA (membrane-fusion protein)
MSKRLLLNIFLIVVVLAISGVAFATVRSSSSSAETTESLATAREGNVIQSVSSTGNVEALTSLSLSFQQQGEVTEIRVSPGQRVTAGQVLAKVDDTQQQKALASAEASLASAEANLAALERGQTGVERESDNASIVSAAASVTSAQQGLTHAQESATINAAKNQQSVDQANEAVASAERGVTDAQADLNQATNALRSLQATADPSWSSSESTSSTLTRYRLDQANCSANASNPSYTPSDGVDCDQVGNLVTFTQSVQTAETALAQAEEQLATAEDGLTNAQTAQASASLQDRQSIENAQTQLTSAQNQYDSAVLGVAVKNQEPKPEELAQSQASVTSAEQQVASAQKNVDDTILRAPVAGVVAAVNGTVGQQSNSGSGSTGSTGATGSTDTSSSSSGSGFIDLTDVGVLNVKVGFTESDAPKVNIGQAAEITLAALPEEEFTGEVIAMDTSSTVVSNVVTYYATVAFDGSPKNVKPGMTASVTVVLDKRDNVVTLPTSAVSTTGTSETVTVKKSDGSTEARTITIGLRGDNAVEITSGLEAGEQVVLTTAADTGTGLPNFPGGGGLGGGGLGGGPPGGGGGGGRP